MASSYVEVKESPDAGNNLPFEITTCESNGVDIQTHIDGEPPRDHTYNKDPDIISEEENLIVSEEEKESSIEESQSYENTPPKKQTKAAKSKLARKPVARREPARTGSRRKVAQFPESIYEDSQVLDTSAEGNEIPESVQAKPGLLKNQRKRRGDSDTSEDETKQMKTESDSKENILNQTDSSVDEDATDKSEDMGEDSIDKKPLKKQKGKEDKKSEEKAAKTKQNQKKSSEVKSLDKKKQTKSKDVGDTDDSLPAGWTKKIVERKSGKTAGSFDIYIYSPEGIKFRSKPDIAAYLLRTKSHLKLEDFSYSKKGLTKGSVKKAEESSEKKPPKEKKTSPVKVGKKKTGIKKSPKIVVKINTPRKSVSDKQSNAKRNRGSPEKSAKVGPSTSGMNSVETKRGGRKK